jgi:hypothetical protein
MMSEAMTWKLIKSAPKDREILVTGYGYNNGKKTRRRFYGHAMWSGDHQNFVDPWREDKSEEYVDLTHWMALPKPPVNPSRESVKE